MKKRNKFFRLFLLFCILFSRFNYSKHEIDNTAFISGYCQNNNSTSNIQQNCEWKIISEVTSDMNKVFFVDSTKGWIVGDSGRIFATDDGGTTWLSQVSETENKLVSIYFMDNQTGFATGYDRTLIRTNNGGDTWTTVEVNGDSGLIYSSLGPGVGDSIYFISNFGEVHCSSDYGGSWSKSYNFNKYGFSYLDCSNSPTCFAMQILLKSFYKSTDGGKVWEKLSIPIEYSSDIYFLNDSIGWVSEDWIISSAWHDSVSLYLTLDGGKTWTRQSTLEGKSLTNIVFFDSFEGWLSVVDKIYYTLDNGKSWMCQFECDSLDWIRDIYFLDDRNGWALTNQGAIIKYGMPIVSVDKFDNAYANEYVLNQNYPNPFNPTTVISYKLLVTSDVCIKVYDLLGREVATVFDGVRSAGNYSVTFDASRMAGGIYLYQLKAGNHVETKKFVLLK
ncbi:MAG: YCF48-related protein [Candidatus Neomarinimicrobiota bacterium]